MKLTLPTAILMSSVMLTFAILFGPNRIPYNNVAKAASIYSHEIIDLRSAVTSIVEDCDGSGYVDGDYLYSLDISC